MLIVPRFDGAFCHSCYSVDVHYCIAGQFSVHLSRPLHATLHDAAFAGYSRQVCWLAGGLSNSSVKTYCAAYHELVACISSRAVVNTCTTVKHTEEEGKSLPSGIMTGASALKSSLICCSRNTVHLCPVSSLPSQTTMYHVL